METAARQADALLCTHRESTMQSSRHHVVPSRRTRSTPLVCLVVALAGLLGTAGPAAASVGGPGHGYGGGAESTESTPSTPPEPLVADLVHRVRTSDPVVFLTIDDGFVRRASDLALLRRLGLPVAAFPTGSMVNAEPGYWVATAALARSHVYTHTYRHIRLPGLSLADQTREICRGADATTAVVRMAPTLFRPPYGESDATTLKAAGACGMAHVVLWDVVVQDGRVTTWGGPLKSGDIAILHYSNHLAADLNVLVRDAASHHLRFGDLAAYADRLV